MNARNKNAARIAHMRQAVERLLILVDKIDEERFYEDFTIHITSERLLEIIGEATTRLDAEFKAKYPDVPWSEMKGLRNIISHEYFNVDYTAIWDIIQNDIPVLHDKLKEIIHNEGFEN